MEELGNLQSTIENMYAYYEISVKHNPLFATDEELVDAESIIVSYKETIKEKNFLKRLFGKKYKVLIHQKEIKKEDLRDKDIIMVHELDYPDRFFYKGKFVRLRVDISKIGDRYEIN